MACNKIIIEENCSSTIFDTLPLYFSTKNKNFKEFTHTILKNLQGLDLAHVLS